MGFWDFDWITKPFNDMINGITNIVNNVLSIFNMVTNIFNCIFKFFNFIGVFVSYCVSFITWIIIDFTPWIGQYIECAFTKIINIPKCFFWYLLDAIIFTLCIPFRFIFWFIGLQNVLSNYVWKPLENINSYIHDNTGIHIIHFPDSVTEKCYICKINPIKKKMPPFCELLKAYREFMSCTGDSSSKCKVNPKYNDLFAGFQNKEPFTLKTYVPVINTPLSIINQPSIESYFVNDENFKKLDIIFQNNFLIGIENIKKDETTIKNDNIQNTDSYYTLIRNYSEQIIYYISDVNSIKFFIISNYRKKKINTTDVSVYDNIQKLKNKNVSDINFINSTVKDILNTFMKVYIEKRTL